MPLSTPRYPGSRPFSANEQPLFFGRDTDFDNLSKLITLDKVLILHGKSGNGKTSLLNARIIPYLTKEKLYKCYTIRFGSCVGESDVDLIRKLSNKILADNGLMTETESLGENVIERILQQTSQSSGLSHIFIVIDQSEELFDYPQRELFKLMNQLSNILYKNIDKMSGIDLPDLHILFSIRSDRLSYLDRLSPFIPNLLNNTYELHSLTKLQATEAIETPALYARGDFTFYSPKFHYSSEALDLILDFLTQKGKIQIQSFQLQIICSYIEKKVIENTELFRNQSGYLEVLPKHISDLNEFYENFYQQIINNLSCTTDTPSVQRMIEEGLIFQERRLTMDGELLKSQYSIKQKCLDELENAHLIQKEKNSSEGFSYELAHDIFIPTIVKFKQRREVNEQVENQKKQFEKVIRKKDEENRELLEKARKNRIKVLLILLVTMIMGIFIFFLFQQSNELKRRQNELEDLNKNLNIVKLEKERELNKLKALPYINNAQFYLNLTIKDEKRALEEYRQAFAIDSTNAFVKEKIKELEKNK